MNYNRTDREYFYELFRPYVLNSPKTLDIGAGVCSFKKYFANNHIISIDANTHDDMVKWSCPEQLPFKNNEFFAIHCSHLVEHLYSDELYYLLKEMDRVLKPFGYICISAPMLTDNFYNDLSHVRPYHIGVFMNYLCGSSQTNHSKDILGNYKMLELHYRRDRLFRKTGFTAIFEKCYDKHV